MKTIALRCALISSLAAAQCLHAADFQGADAILKQIAAKQDSKKTPAGAETGDTPSKLDSDLAAFREAAPALPPEEAAHRWLGFASRFSKFSRQTLATGNINGRQLTFRNIVESLPPPAAWGPLAKSVESLPPAGNISGDGSTVMLRFIAHRLTGNTGALEDDLKRYGDLLKKSSQPEITAQLLGGIRNAMLENSDNGEAVLRQLNATLNMNEKQPAVEDLAIPDLVSLVGEDKAAAFLRRALASNVQVSISQGDETKKLARKIALQMVDSMKKPQWSLVDSLEATALFEALQKHFNGAGNDEINGYKNARTIYLLGLIASHRTKDASAFAETLGNDVSTSLPEAGIRAIESAGLTSELADFLHDLLSKKPDLPFWSDYTVIAVKAGQQDKMVALIEAAAAQPGLDEKKRLIVRGYLSKAYLAVGRVDEGIAILRADIGEAKKGDANPASSILRWAMGTEEDQSQSKSGLALAGLGVVLERNDLVEEGIQVARDALKIPPTARQQYIHGYDVRALAQFLIEQGRGPEAEALLADELAMETQPSAGQYNSNQPDQALVLLMGAYHQAGRPADVLALLDHATQWGSKDLSDILTKGVTLDRNQDYVGYFAASALAAQGQKEKALQILNALLDKEGGYDPAYELLLKLAPREEALARLDALFARDKYEPRPLIWKAKLLLDAGKPEEAEPIARQAVAIDPSDGEHGPGRRMRVYAVLADIREARGDKNDAQFLRGAVTAIRHSENADRFYRAGLISQAVKMYEEALTHFSDAYCIQSRLALRMADIGDFAGAEEHYRRAYELMPDSFGRVESHCFGCERAFEGARAQGIAEKVFTSLAKKRPDKPQVHYLLGYLRFEEERYREALPEFQEAVKHDPEYLNAWKKIAEVGNELHLPAAGRDAVQINLLRLDPLGRHSSFQASTVVDLAAAWNAMAAASKLQPQKPATLYPLPASAQELARLAAAAPQNRFQGYYVPDYNNRQNTRLDPGAMIASNKFIEIIISMMENYGEIFSQL